MIAVMHLVAGPDSLRRCVASYRRHRSGVDHELVIVWNGTDASGRERLGQELAGIAHADLILDEPLLDLAAYALAAQLMEHDRVCCLNATSAIACDGWLAKLDAALSEAPGGVVGATGSWMSTRSAMFHRARLPSAYAGLLPSRAAIARESVEMQRELAAEAGGERVAPTRLRLGLGELVRMRPFPAGHLRTNAFMLERRRFPALLGPAPATAVDARLLESGTHSMTRRVVADGGRVLVVDAQGNSFEPIDWPVSRTLWQGHQEGLLVEDDQTRLYSAGNLTRRRLLSALAWADQADPLLTPAPRRPGQRLSKPSASELMQ